MATDPMIDPSLETSQEPLPSETEEPSDDATPTVEELQEKLAAAESEAKTWKGRAEKATKTQKKDSPVSEEDIDWKIANASRISLVKEQYERELADLESAGVKLSNPLREKALKLAEVEAGVKKPATDDPLPAPTVERSAGAAPNLSVYDQALRVKPETIKEYREYVEGR